MIDKYGVQKVVRLTALAISLSVIAVIPGVLAAPEYADAPFTSQTAAPSWISSDGRYVGITSQTSLINDGQGAGYFIRDRMTQSTARISSLNPNDSSFTDISDNLDYGVIYTTQSLAAEDTNSSHDVYFVNLTNGGYELVSKSTANILGNDISYTSPYGRAMSSDGRYIVFTSYATNLAPGNDQNQGADVFIRDRQLQTTTRVSSNEDGNARSGVSPEIAISDNGKSVVFTTDYHDSGTFLGRSVLVKNLESGVEVLASRSQGVTQPTGITCRQPAINNDGTTLSFVCSKPLVDEVLQEGDHVYRYVSSTNLLNVIDINSNGLVSSTDAVITNINGDGKRVVFTDSFKNLFYWDEYEGYANFVANNTQDMVVSKDGLVVAAQEIGNGSRAGVWTLPPIASDTVPPIVTGEASLPPNVQGWHSSVPTITWSVIDPHPSSGGITTPPPIMANLEGVHTYVSDEACDSAGNCAAGSHTVKLDTALPSGSFTGSTTVFKFLGQTVSGTAGDELSGVEKVEIVNGTTTISSQNGGITLNCDTANTNCTWSASPGALTSGASNLTLRVTDLAGNVYTTTKQYTII